MYQALADLGVSTSSWKSGSVVRSMFTINALIMSSFTELQAAGIEAGFLQLAEGPWLTLKALYDYGITRTEATFATGIVRFTNSTAFEYTEAAGDIVVANSTTKKNYRTTESVFIPANGSVDAFVISVESGSASTSAPGEIDTMVTTLLGVTCTNPDALAADDEESDPLLRERCSAKLGSLSPNGAADAYRYVAFSSVRPDGSNIGITRVTTDNDTTGNVFIYLADPDGEVDPSDVTIIEDNIETQVVPLGVHAHVSSAAAVSVPVTAEVWVTGAGNSSPQVIQLINNALVTMFANKAIGGDRIDTDPGKIFKVNLQSTIMNAVPGCFDCAVTVPASDVTLAINEVAVLSTVTVTVHLEV